MKKYKTVLTIAGSDSSGGAGIQADIKAISACGCYAASVITAITAQNTHEITEIFTLPAKLVGSQLLAVINDINIDAIKIGMLHNRQILDVICQVLTDLKLTPIVFDPVMISKTGNHLMCPDMITALKKQLFPLVTLVTPNLYEAEILLNNHLDDLQAAEHIIRETALTYETNILIKGGHSQDQQTCTDILYLYQQDQFHQYYGPRVQTKNTHGIGCSYASAITAFLAQDFDLPSAISAAKSYINEAVKSGRHYRLGSGSGPIEHFFMLEKNANR